MVLGKLTVPGRPTIWMIVGQGPIALAVGAGVGCLDISGADKSKKFPLAHRTSEKANYLSGRKTCLPGFFFSKIKHTLLYILHSLKFGHRVHV